MAEKLTYTLSEPLQTKRSAAWMPCRFKEEKCYGYRTQSYGDEFKQNAWSDN